MAKISWLGATYTDVPAVSFPDGDGGESVFYEGGGGTLITKTITQNGTYSAQDDDADGYSEVTVNVSGGGVSNYVSGTFKGTTTGAAMDVNIPYTGNGYPVAVVIYPTEGPNNSKTGSFYSLIQRYAISMYVAIKDIQTIAPTYTYNYTERNQATYTMKFKSSATSATSYSYTNNSTMVWHDAGASAAQSVVKVRSKNKISVFIANDYYGFAANIEYTYHVIYSS